MRLAFALLIMCAATGCGQKSELDRCIDEKMAEYDRRYPNAPGNRENVRGGHKIFCEIYLEKNKKN